MLLLMEYTVLALPTVKGGKVAPFAIIKKGDFSRSVLTDTEGNLQKFAIEVPALREVDPQFTEDSSDLGYIVREFLPDGVTAEEVEIFLNNEVLIPT
jgi:hypothetical protein